MQRDSQIHLCILQDLLLVVLILVHAYNSQLVAVLWFCSYKAVPYCLYQGMWSCCMLFLMTCCTALQCCLSVEAACSTEVVSAVALNTCLVPAGAVLHMTPWMVCLHPMCKPARRQMQSMSPLLMLLLPFCHSMYTVPLLTWLGKLYWMTNVFMNMLLKLLAMCSHFCTLAPDECMKQYMNG